MVTALSPPETTMIGQIASACLFPPLMPAAMLMYTASGRLFFCLLPSQACHLLMACQGHGCQASQVLFFHAYMASLMLHRHTVLRMPCYAMLCYASFEFSVFSCLLCLRALSHAARAHAMLQYKYYTGTQGKRLACSTVGVSPLRAAYQRHIYFAKACCAAVFCHAFSHASLLMHAMPQPCHAKAEHAMLCYKSLFLSR